MYVPCIMFISRQPRVQTMNQTMRLPKQWKYITKILNLFTGMHQIVLDFDFKKNTFPAVKINKFTL